MFVKRAKTEWQLRSRVVELGLQTRVMGIVNVTPDSFSDGGLYDVPARAVEHGLALLDQGADILDIGGESTRPGKREELTIAEEQDRVLPVIEGLLRERPGILLSIDTFHAETARAAILAGAEIVNDVSGFLWDTQMAKCCANLKCGVVLMHTRGRPEEWRSLPRLSRAEVFSTVRDGLQVCLKLAREAEVEEKRIVLDPGYGFGKVLEENYPLLAAQGELLELGHPLLVGVSRKAFLGKTLAALYPGKELSPASRDNVTVAATTAAVLAGASIVRVHNVRLATEAVRIADAILNATGE